jgi:hypothetical protein
MQEILILKGNNMSFIDEIKAVTLRIPILGILSAMAIFQQLTTSPVSPHFDDSGLSSDAMIRAFPQCAILNRR